MSHRTRTTLIRLLISIGLTLFFFLSNRIATGQSGHTINISGDVNRITFVQNWDMTMEQPITIRWGISGQPMKEEKIPFTYYKIGMMTPPTGTVSIHFWMPGITVVTNFKPLGNDWYEVPQGNHKLTISGNASSVTFATDWDPTSPLQVNWGVSGKPMQPQQITITNRKAVVKPPTGTVSLLFWQNGVSVVTKFVDLKNGWYAIPR